jgi:RNA polymerase sigma-70 factor (ECF subfamily)
MTVLDPPGADAPAATRTGPAEEDLLVQVAAGGQPAFAALYDRAASRVFGLVRRLLIDAAQAEEVCQEAWVQIWQQAPRFDPTAGSAMTWIMTIAHRRAVDRVRSARASTLRERAAAFEATRQRPFDDVTDSVLAADERRALRHCLTGLTDVQRTAITMAYYTGATHHMISDTLGAPLGTIRTRIRDGLIRLRDCLQQPEIIPGAGH